MRKRRKIVVVLVSALVSIGLVVAGLTSCQTLLVAVMMAWGIDKDYRIEDRRWLDDRLAALDPQRRGASSLPALTFGVAASIMIGQVGDLAGDATDIHSYGIADKMLDVFRELPIDVVRVGGLDDSWRLGNREEIDLADKLMEKVRRAGWKLFIADTQHSAHLFSNPVSWEEFQRIHLRRIEFLARRYRPQYYAVVTEASTYHAFGVKGKMDVDRWVEQTRRALAVVRQVDPGIRTAVVIGPENAAEQSFFRKLLRVPDLDIIALEIYYPHEFPVLDRLLAEHPHKFGKQLWVGESWSGMPSPYTNVPDKEEEDEKWVKLITYYALAHDFDAVMFWPFQYFVTYKKFQEGNGSIDFSKRTRPFRAYQELIRELKARKGTG